MTHSPVKMLGEARVYYTVQSDIERTAAYKNGYHTGKPNRFWFTKDGWNQFAEEVQQAEEQQKEGNE